MEEFKLSSRKHIWEKKEKLQSHLILKYPAVSPFQRTAPPPPASAQGGNGATKPTGIGILRHKQLEHLSIVEAVSFSGTAELTKQGERVRT